MIFTAGALDGTWLIDLERREDARGFFARAWCEREFVDQGLDARISQINVAVSKHAGTLRGMHFQRAPHMEVKVVRCTRGRVFDVAVDLRPASPTFRGWFGVELGEETGRALYLPEGCAHGYLTLTDDAELTYSTSAAYVSQAAGGVRYDDPAFAIVWPSKVNVVSSQDREWPDFTGSET